MNFFSVFIFGLISVFFPRFFAETEPVFVSSPTRIVQNINADWQYLANNLRNVNELGDHTAWQSIDLPHTWNQWDAMDGTPGYRRDASWYQKELFIPEHAEANYLLYFEGANISTQVYVNGQLAGEHIGGYVGFRVDVTRLVQRGAKNTISVRVDNGYNPEVIPSQKADFFIYGGITRDVWLEINPQTFLQEVKVATPQVSAKAAETTVEIGLNTTNHLTSKHTIKAMILDPATNRPINEIGMSATIAAQKGTISLGTITNPKLWSPDDPQRYQVVTQLLENGEVVDEKITTIGYRWFSFAPYGAFFLNGQRLLLRGTHRHEEHAGYGAAMPNSLHRRDVEQMKEMGVNFVRLGHYPQDPEVYRACDELGLIVWDELPWCRGGMGNETWQANTERLLTEQIQQNFHHPSILFWSVGNEIYWLPDFVDGDDEANLNAYVKKLNDLAHQLDPSRLTAIRKYYAGAELVDVFSPSIWSGWYAGVYTNYRNTLVENQKKYPHFLHMEYGGSSHVGRHTENPITGTGMVNDSDWAEVANQVNVKNIAQSGDWTENYIVDLFDHYLSVTETLPNFAGNAQWAFKDFGTPLRPQNAIPYMNQKGLVDRDGKPKDAFYVYKSYWSNDPFTYIESHTWTHRRGPQGKARNLSVFSNCENVELLHAGKSLGKKIRKVGELPAAGLNWDVQFNEGPNQLIARGFKGGKLVAQDTLVVHYDFEQAGNPDEVKLSHQRLPNGDYLIEAVMVDKNGLRVYDYEQEMYFSVDGAGKLYENYGTPTRSRIIQMANGRAAIELRPAAQGKAFIEARNQDFKGSYLTIDFGQENKQGKTAQALLLTQPGSFVLADKNNVSSAYLVQHHLNVPSNLAPQNKWVMFEGPVLENDKVAYRFYADSRHRSDIYGKRVSSLVMDTVSWNYHDIMDWGSDVLKVGNSLGLGSPAIFYQDSLYTLSECSHKTIEIVDSGTKKATVRTTFIGLTIAGHTFDLIQDWSLAAGDYFSEIHLRVINGTLPEGMQFATGIVKHLPEVMTGQAGQFFYASNWGEQSFHHEKMGMAILANRMYQPTAVQDELSHAYTFKNAPAEVRYRFMMAGWERDQSGVNNQEAFRQLVENAGKK